MAKSTDRSDVVVHSAETGSLGNPKGDDAQNEECFPCRAYHPAGKTALILCKLLSSNMGSSRLLPVDTGFTKGDNDCLEPRLGWLLWIYEAFKVRGGS